MLIFYNFSILNVSPIAIEKIAMECTPEEMRKKLKISYKNSNKHTKKTVIQKVRDKNL